jgi:hypothetical protein
MITPRQKRSAAARRVALGLIVAGTLVGVAPAHADPTHTYTNHKPLSGNYPGSYTTRAADSSPTGALQHYPNSQYPNHKPVRGDYPGSYTSSPSTPAQRPSSGFDWLAAGAGAAAMLGLILLLAAAKATTRIARNRRRDVPLVLEIRDDTRGVG